MIVVSECDPPCLNGGACENRMCLCPRGFKGERCEHIRKYPTNHEGRIMLLRIKFGINGSVVVKRLKPLYTFGTEKKIKIHRFTTNLQGLQKVMVKGLSWSIIPWNALLFEKTLKQLSILGSENYGFIVNTCHDKAKRAETRVGFPVIFSRLPMTNWA